MKYNIIVKIISIFILITMITVTISNAFDVTNLTGDIDENQANVAKSYGGKLLGIITSFGVVISVVVLIIIGLKYMIGSVEERAAYKKSLMPYLIGALLTFAASALAQVIYDIAISIKP